MTTAFAEDIEQEEKTLPPVEMHESLFWMPDDPRHLYHHNDAAFKMHRRTRAGVELDMSADSYIWVFTGKRGDGKTTNMTWWAIHFAVLYGFRVISNYPIECIIRKANGQRQHIISEELDLYRLLCFEGDFRDCIILIDEAPDIISHMAAQTWKNRLLNIFVRQLRKYHNHLFLGAQNFDLIDKSMRWQTDIIAECRDASRMYGWGREFRGKTILTHLLDNSGMWTGTTWEDELKKGKPYNQVGVKLEVYPRAMWGDDEHSPVYDSYYVMDVWESLKKVDLHISSYEVGNGGKPDYSGYLQRADNVIRSILDNGCRIETTELYNRMGEATEAEKQKLGKLLRKYGARDGGASRRFLIFDKFNYESFAEEIFS